MKQLLLPTKMLVTCMAFLCVLGGITFVFPTIKGALTLAVGLFLGTLFLDALWSLKRPSLELQREVHSTLPVSAWSQVFVKVTNSEGDGLFLEIHDHCDPQFKEKNPLQTITLESGNTATLTYEVFPTRRGHFIFPGTDVFVTSPLGFWQKKWFYTCYSETKVFPNFREISHYVILATHQRLGMMGIKKLSKRGEGKEFHQLREYRQGDELQKIDWKATSRYRRLISKEYQDERDQQIIFVLDCGRRMHHAEDSSGKSHLDQALNSILLLAYVGVRQGDSVGLYSFGGTEKWLPPKKQENSIRSLLLGMYDIESSTDGSDYLRATQELMTLQNRRSLMVIITNSRDEDHDDLMKMAGQLRKKHLVVIANLREEILSETLQAPIVNFKEALRFQALMQYLEQRNSLHRQLQHLGVYTLDVTPEQLPGSMVNCYLEIKNVGAL